MKEATKGATSAKSSWQILLQELWEYDDPLFESRKDELDNQLVFVRVLYFFLLH